jgi:hypothetical protein
MVGGLAGDASEFDDPEELIPETGEGFPQEARCILQTALSPDPAVPFEGDADDCGGCAEQ